MVGHWESFEERCEALKNVGKTSGTVGSVGKDWGNVGRRRKNVGIARLWIPVDLWSTGAGAGAGVVRQLSCGGGGLREGDQHVVGGAVMHEPGVVLAAS
eukprot:gene15837-biopygen7548